MRENYKILFTLFKTIWVCIRCNNIRMLNTMLGLVGIDNKKLKDHFCRTASSSEEKSIDLSVQGMVTQVHWSGESVWQRYYQKEVVKGSKIS